VSRAPATVGVVGAGTMGAGIAQLACQAGARTLLHDAIPEALQRGAERVRGGLAKAAERGRLDGDPERIAARLEPAAALEDLAPCELVIEAAPESAQLKRELFARLSEIVSERCVLATNTSSLPVTELATAATHPERVVGMHFFNPPPVMRLLEVVAGDASGEEALAVARAAGEAMGKEVIDAADGPGFLVNRCGRPFGMEALRVAEERLASFAEIDRICRQGGGFRMGPFELADLVGVDVGFEIQKSFWELSFGEPRWRPSLITARMAAAGRHGRKAGRGYYDYSGPEHRPADPDPPAPGGGEGLVIVAGDLVIAHELRAAASAAGWTVAEPEQARGEVPELILDCGAGEEELPLQGGPLAVLCAAGSLASLDAGGNAVGFHALPPLDGCALVELTRGEGTSEAAAAVAERFFASLGKHTAWVQDAPGLVLGRIVCQLVNEAAFALSRGVGSAGDIDAGMVLGLNHPRGPLEWGDRIGLDHVLAVLDGLADEQREDRYRAAPLLRRMVLEGRLGAATGAGFHQHP
jgi:3-hydroxybutyryl-CoA dehydrogenase